jgi:hypothetical protein
MSSLGRCNRNPQGLRFFFWGRLWPHSFPESLERPTSGKLDFSSFLYVKFYNVNNNFCKNI